MIPGLLSSLEKQKAAQKKAPVKREFTSEASGLTYSWGGDGEPTQADFDKILKADNEYLAQQKKAKASVDYVKQAKDQAKLRTMRIDTAKAQSEAAGGIGGTSLWASGELQRLSKEAKKALAPLDKALKDADRKLAGPYRDYAADLFLPKPAAKAVKSFTEELKPSSLLTDPLETASRAIVDPKQELYQQFGVVFDPKARPEERIGAGINMIGLLIGAGMKGKTISQALKKLPKGPEFYALMKQSGIGRAEANKMFNELQRLKDLKKSTAPMTMDTSFTVDAPRATTPPTAGADSSATPKAKPKTRAATATTTTPPTAPVVTPAATLPRQLSGAKPRFNVGKDSYAPEFSNDFDKAAYIVTQKNPSKQDAAYLQWAMDSSGLTADEVRAHGQRVRAAIREATKTTKGGDSGSPAKLKIGAVDLNGPASSSPSGPATAPSAPTTPAAPSVAPTAAATPTATTSIPRKVVTAALPKPLAGAKPRYNNGTDSYAPEFESDFDKAAYITSQKTPSKQDAQYLDWAMKESGMTADEVRAHGQKVRAELKKAIATVKGGTSQKPAVVKVGRVGVNPAPSAPSASVAPSPTVAPGAATTTTPTPNVPGARSIQDIDREIKDLEAKLQEAMIAYDYDAADEVIRKQRALLQEKMAGLKGNPKATPPASVAPSSTPPVATATATPTPPPSVAAGGATTTATPSVAPTVAPKAKPASRPVAPVAASASSGTATPPIIKPPVTKPPVAAATPQPKTAGNNASINRRRIFEGRAEIESGSDKIPNRSFNPKDYDLDDFQESLRRRAAEEKPAPFDLTQQEAWIYHRAKLEEIQDQLNTRLEKGDLSPEIRAAYTKLDEDIELTDRMGVEAGTIASQAFAARKNKFDYSPANIKFKAFKLNGNQKLSPEVSTKLSTLLKDEKRFADAAEGTVKFTEAEAAEAAKYIESVGKGIRKAATTEQRKQALDAFRDGIRSIMGKANLGLDPMDLITMAPKIKNLAKAWVAPGSKLDDVVDGVLADAAMIAKQDPKLAPVLLKPDGSLLLDREDVIRVLAGRHRDGVRALRDNIDIDLEAKRFEIDALMGDIKAAAQYKSMGMGERAATEFANFTRGLRLGFDLSPPLNQGRQALASHPKESLEAFRNMFRAAKSEDGLNKIMGKIRTGEHYKLAVASKLKVNAAHIDSGELGFVQTVLLQRLGTKNFRPGPAANRAMMGYLNTLRYQAFENMVNANLKMTGRKTITQTEADNLAEFVNTLTGVGTGKVANALQLFNEGVKGNAFTAPGYAVSKTKLAFGFPLWRALGQAKRTTKEGMDAGAPLKEAAKNGDVATFLEIGKRYGAIATAYGTVYGLLALNGAKIDFRQNSPLSMQVKLPGTNMWIEPTGGLLQIVKLGFRIANPNPDMDRETQMQKVGEYGVPKTTRPSAGMLMGNYLSGKLAPSISSAIKLAQGKAYGKKYNLNTNEGIKNLAMNFGPLTAEQINDIRTTAKGDPKVVALMILSSIFGDSVNVDEKEVPRL